MRWFLCLGCVLVLPVVTFYISALLVSLIPDTSENAGIAATDTFGEYVVMFIQIMGEACLSILLFALFSTSPQFIFGVDADRKSVV
mgnify:CR=1 FL=1